jgi:hypothetical protein
MGHSIDWDNEDKTVVLQQYIGEASKDDLYQLAAKSSKMLSECEHTVHLIIDERLMNFVFNSADMAYLEKTTPKNQGACVMVVHAANLHYKNVVQKLGRHIGPNAFREPYFVASIEEARLFLQDAFGVVYSTHSAK